MRIRMATMLAMVAVAPAALLVVTPVAAQANEREAAILQGQQRVEFRRNQTIDADRRVREAEARVSQARNRLTAAEREHADAKTAMQRAEEDFTQDRARAEEARKAYEDESQRFQALRRGQ